ncbi:MAG TPA: RyR domain-containing protein [Desulfobacteraceae bacterium]|nr:RyR domain-containing protein [Desulfobacteraceae bacterium]HPJ67027.1 RyR domain-containing protein [Desulfobacteraceae bacterium]HPQ27293.1 RyR domain-containing protein [Desulfobacteraceae bacterium]
MALNPIGAEWHKEEIAEFVRMRKHYIEYASFLNDVLKVACEKFAPLAIVQTRAKEVPSFAEKAIRKLPQSERLHSLTSVQEWTDYFDPVNEFTDLCGGRVITQTQQEVDRICHFIQENFEIDWANSEDKRGMLRPDQFGYLSVHYIVQLGNLETLMGVSVPEKIGGLKAEIQVRTLLQHAWADISHDHLYKHQFEVPGHWQRDMARLAAVLESADKEFTQFVDSLCAFAGNYTAYMSNEQVEGELSILDTLLQHAEKEKDGRHIKKLSLRKAKIYEGIADWGSVQKILGAFSETNEPDILKTLGNAICRLHRKYYFDEPYQNGKVLLSRACKLDPSDAEAWAMYAWAWEKEDILRAQEGYSRAYNLQPQEPYYLNSFLEFDIATRKSFSGDSFMKPAMRQAIKTCRSHTEVGIEIPKSLFTVGRLSLLLGEPYQSLNAYIEAVDLFLSPKSIIPEESIDGELDFLRRIDPAKGSLAREVQEGILWIRMLLLISKCIKSGSKKPIENLPDPDEETAEDTGAVVVKRDYKGPVVVAAGSGFEGEGENLKYYRDLISKALAGYQGEVISGGTSNGISGIVASLTRLLKKEDRQGFTTIGYLHGSVPKDAYNNNGYDLFLYTRGSRFSPLEPLQMWLDLLASGIHPSQIKMLGVGGGAIAAIEYRLALALGATVGILGDSRRAADDILQDDRWQNHPNLVNLISDPMTIRALLLSPSSQIGMDAIKKAAKASHEKSIVEKISELFGPDQTLKPSIILEKLDKMLDPAIQPWDNLIESFKNSSIQQKLYAEAILWYEGYALRVLEDFERIKVIEFSSEELRRMAEMEHGRWNLERIRDGWKRGEEKIVEQKISPYLVPWNDLSGEVKERDVDYVKRWPEDFKEAGLEIYKK